MSNIGRGVFAGLRVGVGLTVIWTGYALVRHDPQVLDHLPVGWREAPPFGHVWWIAVLLTLGAGIVLQALPGPARPLPRPRHGSVPDLNPDPGNVAPDMPTPPQMALATSIDMAPEPSLRFADSPAHAPSKASKLKVPNQQLRSKPAPRGTYRKLFLVGQRRPGPP